MMSTFLDVWFITTFFFSTSSSRSFARMGSIMASVLPLPVVACNMHE